MIVVVVYAAALIATLADIPLTDDADAHLGASIQYAEWTARALAGDRVVFRRNQIDEYWRFNAEHPPVAKLAMGASWWLFHRQLRWLDQITAARLGTVAMSTALAWLTFSLCWDYIGRTAAIAAPLLLLTMPRFFFDSHIETLDVAVAATTFLVITAFIRGLTSTAWGLVCGVAFGLALLTKLNAPFFLLAFAAFPFLETSSRVQARSRRVAGLPIALPAMIAIGPLMFVALWPWMWHDTVGRLAKYVLFHLRHYGILFLYFGRIYGDAPAPWHAPFVMTAITTPPMVLALASLTAVMIVGSVNNNRIRRLLLAGDPLVTDEHLRRDVGTLLLLAAAAAIGPAAWPSAPKYAGVKLFLPLFPLLAVLAAWGAQIIASFVRSRTQLVSPEWAAPLVIAAAVLPAAIGLSRLHPYELSYYNALIGGLPGAAKAGFETQYYDLIYVKMLNWFNDNLPFGARITFLPNNKEYIRNGPWLFWDGRIRRDLQFVDFDHADVLVLTHEDRWPQYRALRREYESRPRLWQLDVEGVPLVTIYRLTAP